MSLSDIELEYAMGNYDKARKQLRRYLRSNPNSVDGWQLALDLAENDAAKEQAEAGLRKARAAEGEQTVWDDDEWDSAPAPQIADSFEPQPSGEAPSSGSGGSFQMTKGSSSGAAATINLGSGSGTDDRPHAIGVLVATFFFPILGPILGLVFLSMANSAEQSGQDVQNKGCLIQALVVSLVLIGISVLAVCLALFIPLLAGEF